MLSPLSFSIEKELWCVGMKLVCEGRSGRYQDVFMVATSTK